MKYSLILVSLLAIAGIGFFAVKDFSGQGANVLGSVQRGADHVVISGILHTDSDGRMYVQTSDQGNIFLDLSVTDVGIFKEEGAYVSVSGDTLLDGVLSNDSSAAIPAVDKKESLIGSTLKKITEVFKPEQKKLFRLSDDPDIALKLYISSEYGVKDFSKMTKTSITGELVTIHGHDFAELRNTDSTHDHSTHKHSDSMDIQRYLKDGKTGVLYRVQDIEKSKELLNDMTVTLTGYVLPGNARTKSVTKEQSSITPATRTIIVNEKQFSRENASMGLRKALPPFMQAKDELTLKNVQATQPYKGLVVLVDMTEGTVDTLPAPAQVKTMIAPGPIKDYYLEQSFGRVSYDVDVINWIPVPPGVTEFLFEAPSFFEQYVAQNNLDLSLYDQIVYVVADGPTGGGYATIGKRDFLVGNRQYSMAQSYVNIYTQNSDVFNIGPNDNFFSEFQFIYAHEMGHNLGVAHDRSYLCPPFAISKPSECYSNEYGNAYSVMGIGRLGTHFSGLFKSMLNWIPLQNQIWIHDSGTYIVSPLETAQAKLLVIDFDDNGTPEYMVDARKAIGFDVPPAANQNHSTVSLGGVFIYRTYYPYAFSPYIINEYLSPKVIDSYPANQAYGLDEQMVLGDGRTFIDPALGVQITASSLPNGTVQVAATKLQPTCQTFPPVVNAYFQDGGSIDKDGMVSAALADQNEEIYLGIMGFLTINDYPACYSEADLLVTIELDGQAQQSVGAHLYLPSFNEMPYNYGIYPIINVSDVPLGPHVFTITATNSETGLSSFTSLPFTLVQ